MRHEANPCLPPPHLLEALREPRRRRQRDPRAREIFRRWRHLGRPIVVAEFRELVDFPTPQPRVTADCIRVIMTSVAAAGFALFDEDGGLPVPELLALLRTQAGIAIECAELVIARANECDDDDPQKLRYLQTARMLVDRANATYPGFRRLMALPVSG